MKHHYEHKTLGQLTLDEVAEICMSHDECDPSCPLWNIYDDDEFSGGLECPYDEIVCWGHLGYEVGQNRPQTKDDTIERIITTLRYAKKRNGMERDGKLHEAMRMLRLELENQ